MGKKYIVSIDKSLPSSEQGILKNRIGKMKLNVISQLDALGIMAVEAEDDQAIHELRQVKGILAVEDDSPMDAL